MYLDPGFGRMIIQFLVAAIAACGAYAVIFRRRIKEFFVRRKNGGAAATTETVEKKDKE